MIDLTDFFEPVEIISDKTFFVNSEETLLGTSHIHNNSELFKKEPLLENASVVFFALPDFQDDSEKFLKGIKTIRQKLYGLAKLKSNVSFYDLGNFKKTATVQDYESGVKMVLEMLFEANIRVIIFSELSLPVSVAKSLSAYYPGSTVLMVNNHFEDYEKFEMMTEESGLALDFGLLGFQNYLTSNIQINQGKERFMEFVRLSEIKNKIQEAEPYFRDADWAAMSLNAVCQRDALASEKPSPNGFHAEEFCGMSYFAGLGCRNKIISFAGYDALKDKNNQSAFLIAQAIWLNLDGFAGHVQEHPAIQKQNIQRYIVINEEYGKHFIFYKSNLTGRWWMEIPGKKKKNIIVAASYKDYKMASNQKIPARWWNLFRRYF